MAEVLGTSAGTHTQGQRLQSNINASRRIPQWLKKTINVSADVAPLYQLMNKFGDNGEVEDSSYFHLETDYNRRSVTQSGSIASGVTTLSLSSGHTAAVTVGTELKCWRTTEIMRVTGVNVAANTVDVTRGHKGTTPAALASDILGIIGFSDTEGNTSPEAVSTEPSIKTNYTQVFRRAIELSGRDMNTAVYGEDELQRLKKLAMEDLLLDIEYTMLFSNGVSSSNPTGTGGLEYWVTTNVRNQAGAALDELTFRDDMRGWMRRNQKSSDCAILAGEAFCANADSWKADLLTYRPDDEILDITATRYRTSFGEIKIIRHGLLSPIGSDETTANLGPQGFAFGVNFKRCGKRTFKGRGIQPRPNIQANDQDGYKWEYWGDLGLYLANEKSFQIWKGVAVPS